MDALQPVNRPGGHPATRSPSETLLPPLAFRAIDLLDWRPPRPLAALACAACACACTAAALRLYAHLRRPTPT